MDGLPKAMRAVVTGGGSGLGRGFCAQIAARGGSVVVADINEANAAETVKILESRGAKAWVYRIDVSNADEVEALAAYAEKVMGGVDLIVNNAGVATVGSVGDVPVSDWHWLMGVNLFGVIYGCHAFIPRFKKQKSGFIINVASAAGLLSAPNMAPYNVSKAGVVSLSETLFAEVKNDNIGVTVLCPTFFKTNILNAARDHAKGNDGGRRMAQKAMDDAKVTADDVARIALDAADARELYVIPQADGRWAWRLKRLAPRSFYKGMNRVEKFMMKRAAR
jgi:NAD(P)-dependent dehydrogenase (short-subunit alcohol dehydrogenase family)